MVENNLLLDSKFVVGHNFLDLTFVGRQNLAAMVVLVELDMPLLDYNLLVVGLDFDRKLVEHIHYIEWHPHRLRILMVMVDLIHIHIEQLVTVVEDQ